MDEIEQLAQQLGATLNTQGRTLTLAESCTGGGIAEAVTRIAGSSAWFDRGFVTYSNQSKQDMLGVPSAVIESYGAVSIETVEVMAAGALEYSQADCAIAVSGVAGPDGGSADKPVGTVCIAWVVPGKVVNTEQLLLPGDRAAIRTATIITALQGLLDRLAT